MTRGREMRNLFKIYIFQIYFAWQELDATNDVKTKVATYGKKMLKQNIVTNGRYMLSWKQAHFESVFS